MGMENRDHLFCQCSFSTRIWRESMLRCCIMQPYFAWQDVMEEGCKSWCTTSLFGVVCRLVLRSFTVYGLWRARNEVKHGGHPRTDEQILKHIFWEVRSRVAEKRKFKNKPNISLCHSWNMDTAMLVWCFALFVVCFICLVDFVL
jgi:hypothetical protein